MRSRLPVNQWVNWAAALLVLAFAILLVFGEASDRRRADRENYSRLLERCAAESGQPAPRPIARPYRDGDCWYWNHYALQIAKGEAIRIRWSNVDNAPFGRPLHWSSLFGWILAAAGRLCAATGMELTSAVAFAGDWINPLLHVLFIGTVFVMTLRIGPFTASLLAATVGLTGPMIDAFEFGRPDYQGLHLLLSTVALLGVANAAVDPGNGKRWMLGSALASALGLWLGAAVQFPIVAMIGLGGLVSSVQARRAGKTPLISPEAWRIWGGAGCGASLLFYLLEYAPALKILTEANGPLHAAAWWAGSEIVALTSQPDFKRPTTRFILPTLVLAAFGYIVIRGPEDWRIAQDPASITCLMGATEFEPYRFSIPSLVFDFRGLLLAIPAAFIALRWAPRNRLPGANGLLLLPVGFLGLLAASQMRWEGIFTGAIAAWLFYVGTSCRRVSPILACSAAIALSFSTWVHRSRIEPLRSGMPSNHAIQASIMTYVADAIDRDANLGPRIVMAPPFMMACLLCDRADVQLVISSYWDNRDGMRAGIQFFSSTTDEQALEIVRARGIQYVLVDSGRISGDSAALIPGLGNPDLSSVDIHRTLLRRIEKPGVPIVPPWLEKVPIVFPGPIARLAAGVHLFRVKPLIPSPGP